VSHRIFGRFLRQQRRQFARQGSDSLCPLFVSHRTSLGFVAADKTALRDG
jgi:hypothetical protein